MKKWLVIMLCSGYMGVSGQVFVNETSVDEFTGVKSIMTNLFNLAPRKSVKAVIGNFNDIYALSCMPMTDLGCGGFNGNYIIFLFEDGSTIEYDNDIADRDCGTFNESRYIIEPLDFVGKKVVKVRISKSENHRDYDWYQEQNMIDILTIVGYEIEVDNESVIDSTSN